MTSELQTAWNNRLKQGWFEKTEALRVFHGPTEGCGETQSLAIEKFQDHYWIIEWEKSEWERSPRKSNDEIRGISSGLKQTVSDFLKSYGALSAVLLARPTEGVPAGPVTLFGVPPDRLEVRETQCHFIIRFSHTRHPGLFLDHFPLRQWLLANARGLKVLNTFAYTGSLSVASALGGAAHVTTLDLSKPTLAWARENWALNGLTETSGSFLQGDYFEWLPRLKRKSEKFDCVILDPPSFSRGTRGSFSTAKDLVRLHEAALDVLAPGGFLITSINSAGVGVSKYEADVREAARSKKLELRVIERIAAPDTFPGAGYLKGWIFRVARKGEPPQ